MGSGQQPNWGTIGIVSGVAGVAIGILLLLVVPEQPWIGLVVAVLSVVDGYFLARILPQMIKNRGD